MLIWMAARQIAGIPRMEKALLDVYQVGKVEIRR